MKVYTLSAAESFEHRPSHPERTASKSGSGLNFDVTYCEWSTREAMLKHIDKQDADRMVGQRGWKACKIEGRMQ